MSAWQTIETAPKDGTPILMIFKAYASRNYIAGRHAWGRVRIGRWKSSYWQLDASGHYRDDATHWMPLPDPPEPIPLVRESVG